MNTFELSKAFFDYCLNNPDKIKTGHIALYYFIIDHCNRLGWPDKVGLPSHYAMTVLGVSRYETYNSYLTGLVECGFVNIVEKSKNQYSATIISLSNAVLKNSEAHSTAIVQHIAERPYSTPESDSSILKPKTLNLKPKTIVPEFSEFKTFALEHMKNVDLNKLELKFKSWKEGGWKTGKGQPIKNWKSTLLNTLQYLSKDQIQKQNDDSWSGRKAL